MLNTNIRLYLYHLFVYDVTVAALIRLLVFQVFLICHNTCFGYSVNAALKQTIYTCLNIFTNCSVGFFFITILKFKTKSNRNGENSHFLSKLAL